MTVNLNSRAERSPLARPAGQGSASGLNRPVPDDRQLRHIEAEPPERDTIETSFSGQEALRKLGQTREKGDGEKGLRSGAARSSSEAVSTKTLPLRPPRPPAPVSPGPGIRP